MPEHLTGQTGYDELPEAIKQEYTLKEWMWMTDQQKSDLRMNPVPPEWDE